MPDITVVEVDKIAMVVKTNNRVTVVAGGNQGPPGPLGPSGGEVVERTASVDLGGHRVVAINAANEVLYASHADATALQVFGFTTAAVLEDATVEVRQNGVLDWPANDLTPDSPVYLTTSGQVSHTPPATGYIRQVGVALASGKLQVAIGPAYYQG